MTIRPADLVVNRWRARYRGLSFPVSVGRGGIATKLGEGDGITPIGTWRIAEIRYRADRGAAPAFCGPQSAISPRDKWSDDAADPAYNTEIKEFSYTFSHERLSRADPLYDRIGILDFNWPQPVQGKGSAIFLHVWRKPRHPTEGCIALAPDVLDWVLNTWVPAARIIVRP